MAYHQNKYLRINVLNRNKRLYQLICTSIASTSFISETVVPHGPYNNSPYKSGLTSFQTGIPDLSMM